MPQVRLAAVLKVTRLNILRAMAFKNRLRRQEKGKRCQTLPQMVLMEMSKSIFLQVLGYLKKQFGAFRSVN
jgi:hypothetical protein